MLHSSLHVDIIPCGHLGQYPLLLSQAPVVAYLIADAVIIAYDMLPWLYALLPAHCLPRLPLHRWHVAT